MKTPQPIEQSPRIERPSEKFSIGSESETIAWSLVQENLEVLSEMVKSTQELRDLIPEQYNQETY